MKESMAIVHLSRSHGRRNENNAISSDEQHGNVPLRGFVHFLIRLFVNFDGRYALFHLAQNHVQMLVVSVQSTAKLTIIAHLQTKEREIYDTHENGTTMDQLEIELC